LIGLIGSIKRRPFFAFKASVFVKTAPDKTQGKQAPPLNSGISLPDFMKILVFNPAYCGISCLSLNILWYSTPHLCAGFRVLILYTKVLNPALVCGISRLDFIYQGAQPRTCVRDFAS
jgi:hypothetical protein